MARTVVFDFDGVIHSYTSGFIGIDNIPDPPVEGIKDTIAQLRKEGYKVVVVTTRATQPAGKFAVIRWLHKHRIAVDDVTGQKPPAMVYVDDRAICFNGNTEGLVEQVKNFEPWNRK